MRRVLSLASFAVSSLACASSVVVNVDARYYGYQFPTDPAPHVGQVLTPLTNAPNGQFNEVALAAGIYTISNAAGLAGADPNFTGWRFNGGDNWVWGIVVTKTTGECVFYMDAGGLQSSQALIASQPDVIGARGTLVLSEPTTLRFMIRDYGLSDNAGGVAVLVTGECVADFNGDHVIDFFDYLDFVNAFAMGDLHADVNHDGSVDFFDYLDFVATFNGGC